MTNPQMIPEGPRLTPSDLEPMMPPRERDSRVRKAAKSFRGRAREGGPGDRKPARWSRLSSCPAAVAEGGRPKAACAVGGLGVHAGGQRQEPAVGADRRRDRLPELRRTDALRVGVHLRQVPAEPRVP